MMTEAVVNGSHRHRGGRREEGEEKRDEGGGTG